MSFFSNDTLCAECSRKEEEIRAKIKENWGADADLEYEGCGFIPELRGEQSGTQKGRSRWEKEATESTTSKGFQQGERREVEETVSMGAVGYLTKNDLIVELFSAIDTIRQGGQYISRQVRLQ